MGRTKATYETKSVNRGFRMRPSTLTLLKQIADLKNKKQNGYMEELILKEAKNLNLIKKEGVK